MDIAFELIRNGIGSSIVIMVRRACVAVCLGFVMLLVSFIPGRATAVSAVLYPCSVKATITGRVTDSASGEALVGAIIQIEPLHRGMATGSDGAFVMRNVPTGEYTVYVSYIGYRVHEMKLLLRSDMHVEFRLVAETMVLPEMQILPGRPALPFLPSHSKAELSDAGMDRRQSQTLGEILSTVPGVTSLQTGSSIAKPVIRGLHSQRVLVINSGITQEGQQWGGEHAPEIDPLASERIVVLKGAAGVEYGPGAIGGVINVKSHGIRTKPGMNGFFVLDGFSNNAQGAMSLLVKGASELLPGFGLTAQASVRYAGDSRTREYIIGNSGFRELDVSLTGGWICGRTEVQSTYKHFGTELGVYPGSHVGNADDLFRAIAAGRPLRSYNFTYAIDAPKQSITHDLFTAQCKTRLAGIGLLSTSVGVQQNHRQEFDLHRRWYDTLSSVSTTPAFDLLLTTYNIGLKLQHDPIGLFAGSIGICLQRQVDVGNSQTFLIPDHLSYDGGVYAIESWSKGMLTLNGGLRWDVRQTTVYPYAPKGISRTVLDYSCGSVVFGACLDLPYGLWTSLNVGTSWRPPGINEMFSSGVHHGTAQYEIGDPSLMPERGLSLDASVNHESGSLHAEISAFVNVIHHYIFFCPDLTPTLTLRGLFPTFRYRQTDALLKGFEAGVSYDALDCLRVGATAGIVRGDDMANSTPLYQMPADHFKISTEFHYSRCWIMTNMSFETSCTIVLRQTRVPAFPDYAPPPAGYALFDVAAGAVIAFGGSNIHVQLSVHNVFDTMHRDYLSRLRYFIDDPGRNIGLRIRVPFGSEG
jgi:iron complex outermembrane receptor protein